MRLSDFWKQALEELKAGRAVYACMVVDQQKGSPGTKAARLLLTKDGRQFGTIGGGIMESDELAYAAKLLADETEESLAAPELRNVKHRVTDRAEASGLICGGGQTNLRMILSPDRHLGLVGKIAEAAAREANQAVCIDKTTIQIVEVVESSVDESVELIDGASDDWRVLLHLRNPRRMVIFGGGHCGAALARLMDDLGYAVSVVEPRADVLKAADLPKSVRPILKSFEPGAARVECAAETLAVVMTFSMATDVEALAGALRGGFKSIGVMGSRPKIARIRALLLEKGVSRWQVDSIRAPIGLEFNSDTPQEIAVSVAAEVLLNRERNKNG